jgi:hypothetical protein
MAESITVLERRKHMNRIELADAMLRGIHAPNTIECQTAYIYVSEGVCKCCPLGATLIGLHDGDFIQARAAFTEISRRLRGQDEYLMMARLLAIPVSLAIEIEHKHLNGMPIEQIAAWLKSEEVGGSINV